METTNMKSSSLQLSKSGEEQIESFTLPESVDPYTVEAYMDKLGRLIVEAPLVH